MSVPVSFIRTGDVLIYICAVLAPPINIFGSQTQDPINVDEDDDARPMSTAQSVNNARRRSFGKVADQDEADPNIKYKKARSGSTKKVKVVSPHSYPAGTSQQRSSAGSQAGSIQQNMSEQLEIAVLCLPRTVRLCHSALSSRDLAPLTACLHSIQLSSCDDNERRAINDHTIQIDAFQRYQRTAKQHGLWFTIEVNTTEGALLPQLHASIRRHFSSEGLTLPSGDQLEDVEDFGTLPWQLVNMKKRRNGDYYTMAREVSLHAVNITVPALKRLQGCHNPDSEHVTNWIIISRCCSL